MSNIEFYFTRKQTFLIKIILLFAIFLLPISSKDLQFMNYTQILKEVKELKKNFSNFVQLDYGEEIFSGINNEKCLLNDSDPKKYEMCKFPILRITNFARPAEQTNKHPQVMIIGGTEGKERLSPSAIVSWAKYILANKKQHLSLLNSVTILLLPLMDPYSYSKGVSRSKNILLDFPLKSKTDQCLSTAPARILNEVYRTNQISLTLFLANNKNNEKNYYLSKIFLYNFLRLSTN